MATGGDTLRKDQVKQSLEITFGFYAYIFVSVRERKMLQLPSRIEKNVCFGIRDFVNLRLKQLERAANTMSLYLNKTSNKITELSLPVNNTIDLR